MTKPRIIFWTVSLIAAILLSSCASAATSTPIAPITSPLGTDIVPPTAVPTDLVAPVLPEITTIPSTQVAEVQPAPTSRGPNLEATDPTTVNLAAGQLQLVEFFRFT